MSEPVIVALIIGVGGPAVLFGLNRMFGGRRKDLLSEWQSWTAELKERVAALEDDVGKLKKDLEAERGANKRLESQNQRQASMLTALVRWAILLRDEVIRLGGNLPPAPVEVEAAMTNLDP